MGKKIFFIGLFILSFLSSELIKAQVFNDKDFTTINVDKLSDQQIKQFIQQAESAGFGEDKLEQVAAAKGMPNQEITKLRRRVEIIKRQEKSTGTKKENTTRTVKTSEKEVEERSEPSTIKNQKRSKIFGAELFTNSNISFEPNLRLATPSDYQIGPDDELLIDIYGLSEANYNVQVTPEGNVNIPMVGVVNVSSATIEQATSRIRAKLSTIYSGLNNGSTKLKISLGNIRSIRVILTGEIVKPGTYTLPSVATVFNALYASGGPSENGSFRQVQIIRAGTVVAILDVYDFLLYGSLKNSIRLQDQDVIRIPTYKTRIEISGEVKRPGIFEMKYGESLSDLLRFAGDFTEYAYKARIKVLKNTETEHQIQDITIDQYNNYEPSTGDQYFVEKILDRFKNRITIKGAVFRPGEFELQAGLTLSQLITKAEGLKEDAFGNRGYIIRLKNNLTSEVISFNTSKIISGEEQDIALQREDVISIPSIFDLKEEYTMSIDGEVRSPGTFHYAENTSLEDLIIMAGGFNEGASAKRIEVARRIRNINLKSDTTAVAQVFTINIDRDLKEKAGAFMLMPFDIVSVRPSPGYEVQRRVRIEGEVLYPGNYVITNKNDRISDLIQRAGGLTAFAYKEGASLKRIHGNNSQIEQEKEELKLKQFSQIQKNNADSAMIDINSEAVRNNYVGIDLTRILERPGKRFDLMLEEGDLIYIPKQLQTVKVSGEVLSPTSVVFASSSFKKYILSSGGFSGKALKKRAYITYANGSTVGTKKILFFNHYPKVKPGAEIFVPRKEDSKNRLSTSEIVAISTGLATIATLIFTIFR